MRNKSSFGLLLAAALTAPACDDEPNFQDLVRKCSRDYGRERTLAFTPVVGDVELGGGRMTTKYTCLDTTGDRRVDYVCKTARDRVKGQVTRCVSSVEENGEGE